jgi:peptidyl-prolyl cis-trans isomerase C
MRTLPLLLALLAGCSNTTTTGSADAGSSALLGAPDGPPVAVVNGEVLSEPLLVVFARKAGLDPAVPEQRQRALDALVDSVLLTQEALSDQTLDRSEMRAEATIARLQSVATRRLAAQRERLQADDAQVAALYEQEKQRAGDTEWRSQHLLFADRAGAEAALARARAEGASFDALLAEYANGGAKQATELPWSNATQLPESLVEALQQLGDGEVAPVVLESRFGFHVLRRLEARPFSPPSLEQVREGARRQLIEQGLKDYVGGLRAKAQISTGAAAPGG